MTSFSQGLVVTTAMLFSTTLLYLVFSRQKIHDPPQSLRSCLYSEEKKRERKMKKKVRFDESVKEGREKSSEVTMKEKQRKRNRGYSNCRNETAKIPANRMALYNGILKERMHSMEFSH